MELTPASRDALLACLAEAQGIGAIGSGDLGPHVFHAARYLPEDPGPARCCDLGSGGGLPALPLALMWPDTTWYLIEAWERRARLLVRSVERLGLGDRVTVLAERAETVGRSELRASVDIVTARSFGRSAVTLECAAPLLSFGGLVVVSGRQDDPAWPNSVLQDLGLGDVAIRTELTGHYRSARKVAATSDRFPRRVGVPERRLLF